MCRNQLRADYRIIAAKKTVAAICHDTIRYKDDRWIISGRYSGEGVNPFESIGYWLISSSGHMTAMVVEDETFGSGYYFDPNEGEATFEVGGLDGFFQAWADEKGWFQTRFIRFIDA